MFKFEFRENTYQGKTADEIRQQILQQFDKDTQEMRAALNKRITQQRASLDLAQQRACEAIEEEFAQTMVKLKEQGGVDFYKKKRELTQSCFEKRNHISQDHRPQYQALEQKKVQFVQERTKIRNEIFQTLRGNFLADLEPIPEQEEVSKQEKAADMRENIKNFPPERSNTTVLSSTPEDNQQVKKTNFNSTSLGKKATSLAFKALETIVPATEASTLDKSKNKTRSPFQNKMRKNFPKLAAFSDGLAATDTNPIHGVTSLTKGIGDGVVELGKHLGEEAARVRLGEKTKTGHFVKAAASFIGEEAARLRLGEQTLTGSAGRRAKSFVQEEISRFNSGQSTVTEQSAANLLDKIGSTPIDQSLQSIGKFAFQGASGGYAFKKTAQGLHWAWQEGRVQHGLHTFNNKVKVEHVFSKAKGGKAPKHGHVYDTPQNRRIITETFINKNNFVFKSKHGVETFAKYLADGTEAWAEKHNGIVRSAGINKTPKYYDSLGKLKPISPEYIGPKP